MMAFDWDDLKTLIACADEGSLSGAAAMMGISQPTLGRKIDALEASLGVQLFTRSPRGMALTVTGQHMLAHAREVEAAAARLSMAAAGRGEAVKGVVRITASAVLATYRLPPILARIVQAEPGVEIELVVSDATDNLHLREADIAIRMYRPEQLGLIARKITDIETGLFASHGYLSKHGMPTVETIGSHRMVGYDRNPIMRNFVKDSGMSTPKAFFPLRTDDQVVNWRIALAGGGIGVTQREVGLTEPLMVPVLPDIEMPSLPVWLTVHEELRTSSLIRRVFDRLAEDVAALT